MGSVSSSLAGVAGTVRERGRGYRGVVVVVGQRGRPGDNRSGLDSRLAGLFAGRGEVQGKLHNE